MEAETKKAISEYIHELGAEYPLTRQHGRMMLVYIGEGSVPALLNALESDNVNVRFEAAHALGEFVSPEIISALCKTIMLDEDFSVRWVAMEGLIASGRACLPVMLELFLKHFDSPWLSEGIHHILRVLKDRGQLKPLEIVVFKTLDQSISHGLEFGWTEQAATAAEKALEALDHELGQR
jgi:HEAT repeat protein